MYLSVIIRHTLIPNLSKSKIFVLRSFRSLSINGIWAFQNPTKAGEGCGTPVERGNRGIYGALMTRAKA
jgi:hypothetical protein